MKSDQAEILSTNRLKFKKDELIVKEGDYGISIYKIIKGEVLIFTESEGIEIPLATFEPGEIIGEVVFLSGRGERRSASARALEDSELEVWHPDMLAKEYEQMPPILKTIADQALRRSIRMNKFLVQLTVKSRGRSKLLQKGDPWAPKRRYYRKSVSLDFVSRPVGDGAGSGFQGQIKDISMGGVGMEVWPRNASKFPYKPGDEFIVNTVLPNEKDVGFQAKIVSIKEAKSPGKLFISMSYTDLTDGAVKNLGFFLMPA